jgi:mitochondrial import receptor subunit TOM40
MALNGWLAVVALGQKGTCVTYCHKVSDQLKVGMEVGSSPKMQDTSVSLGCQLDLSKANLLFKGSVDSNWMAGTPIHETGLTKSLQELVPEWL